MLIVKQRGIKYHFLSFWYDSIWDRTQVSRAFGEQSNRQANGLVLVCEQLYLQITILITYDLFTISWDSVIIPIW